MRTDPTIRGRSNPDPLDELDAKDLVFELKSSVVAADRDTHKSAYDVKEATEEVVDRISRLQRVEEQRDRAVKLLWRAERQLRRGDYSSIQEEVANDIETLLADLEPDAEDDG